VANEQAMELFALAPGDVGRRLQDLTLSYRPVELRSRIDRVLEGHAPLPPEHVEHRTPRGELRTFELHVTPLHDGDALLGVAVAFVDTTTADRLRARVEEAGHALETAFEELQSTNEELETTNEELQSTIEELETTNEELQSTNEELETMNEELQSTNEELETTNAELDLRTRELDSLNAYLGSILGSVRAGVVVVDTAYQIRVWNPRAEDLWGVRDHEALGQPLQNLEIGLPVERLKGAVRAAVEGRSETGEVVLDAVNRRGRPIVCRVRVAPLRGPDGITGAVLVMEDQPAPAAQETAR
jgi:two-component system CheB/CheR fusion protein